jgi:two-component system, OmpR family, alkaline phosphatase synthesis response regulator PhoP
MASILIVDDEPENLELLEAVLAPTGHTIRSAGGGREALQAVQQERPDLILLDLMMPEVSGFEVCEMLRANEATARLPIIVVTALDQLGIKERTLTLGADDYLTKPIQPTDVVARVQAMMQVRHLEQDLDRTLAYLHELEVARHSHRRRALSAMGAIPAAAPRQPAGLMPPTILIVDDEELMRQFYGDLLVGGGFRVVTASSGPEALSALPQYPVETVVLDIMMPGVSGLEALEQIRQIAPDLPVIILTARPSSQNAIAALKLGAFDFIVKGIQQELVIVAVHRAIRYFAQLREKEHIVETLQARIRELEARIGELEGRPA